jgi:hypothetical protein
LGHVEQDFGVPRIEVVRLAEKLQSLFELGLMGSLVKAGQEIVQVHLKARRRAVELALVPLDRVQEHLVGRDVSPGCPQWRR